MRADAVCNKPVGHLLYEMKNVGHKRFVSLQGKVALLREQDKQLTYNLTLRSVSVTIVAVQLVYCE